MSRITLDLSNLVNYQPGGKREIWRKYVNLISKIYFLLVIILFPFYFIKKNLKNYFRRVKELLEHCKTSRHSMEFYYTQKMIKAKEEERRASDKLRVFKLYNFFYYYEIFYTLLFIYKFLLKYIKGSTTINSDERFKKRRKIITIISSNY